MEQLVAFVAAAESSSFCSAARKLGVTQPALSRRLAEIEDALRLKLFRRTAQGAELSTGGSAFLCKARRLVAAHAELRSCLANWRATQGGRIQVAGTSSLIPIVLPALMRGLAREFGNAAMEVKSVLGPEVRRCVLERESSIGVCFEAGQDARLRYTHVLRAPMGVLASPLLRLPDPIRSLDDLAGIPLLRFGEDSLVCQLLGRHRIRFDSYFKSPLTVTCILASYEMVQQGHAAVICSGIGASHQQAAGLRFIPLANLLPAGDVYVVSRRDAAFHPVEEILRELLRDSIHETEWHASVQRIQCTSRREAPHQGAAGEVASFA